MLMDREVTTSKVEELVRSAAAAASSVDRVPPRCSCRERRSGSTRCRSGTVTKRGSPGSSTKPSSCRARPLTASGPRRPRGQRVRRCRSQRTRTQRNDHLEHDPVLRPRRPDDRQAPQANVHWLGTDRLAGAAPCLTPSTPASSIAPAGRRSQSGVHGPADSSRFWPTEHCTSYLPTSSCGGWVINRRCRRRRR